MSPSREKQEVSAVTELRYKWSLTDLIQVHHYSIDSVSSLSILGMNSWISPEQMIVDLIKQLKGTTLSDAL